MMNLTAFLHGYPPFWSMGGEVSTHRTLRSVQGSTVFTNTDQDYEIDGVQVKRITATTAVSRIVDHARSVDSRVLFGHSTLSAVTIRAARRMGIPSILAVHAPPNFALDLRRAWGGATIRLYNTEAARREWHDPMGWLLHPPVGKPLGDIGDNPNKDAITLTSSLLNKGASQVMQLAKKWPSRRFIIVRSPAHTTHGSADFDKIAGELPNVEVWSRLHPDEMWRLWAETKVLLVPSYYETYGMSALEAAWYGIPSVHVDTPHVREGIGTAARLLSSRSIEELEVAIQEVEADYNMWSATAHSRVHQVYAREQVELEQFASRVAELATE